MQEKDKNSIVSTKDINQVYSDLVNGDKRLEYISRKIDKISAAVYLIAGYIEKDELLRTKLQEGGLSLIQEKVGLFHKGQSEKTARELLASLFELGTYLEVASSGGLISEMNFLILKEECGNVAVALNEYGTSSKRQGVPLSSEFFKTEDIRQTDSSKVSSDLKRESRRTLETPESDLPKNVLYSSPVSHEVGRVAEKKKSRRDVILGLLKQRSGISIKDFSNLIKDCSEKTIQRELLEMVEEGVIEKKGERRWSTYSLKNS